MMLEQDATVVESRDGQIWVEAEARSSCSQCSTSSCSTSVISKMFGMKPNLLQVENTLQAKAGDRVIIGIPDSVLVKASVWAYLAPLFGMVMAVLLAQAQGFGDGTQGIAAMAGLAAGFFMVGRFTRSARQRSTFSPLLLRIKGRNQISVDLGSI
jgi:sigma-E factor negative regulatory protein RseC